MKGGGGEGDSLDRQGVSKVGPSRCVQGVSTKAYQPRRVHQGESLIPLTCYWVHTSPLPYWVHASPTLQPPPPLLGPHLPHATAPPSPTRCTPPPHYCPPPPLLGARLPHATAPPLPYWVHAPPRYSPPLPYWVHASPTLQPPPSPTGSHHTHCASPALQPPPSPTGGHSLLGCANISGCLAGGSRLSPRLLFRGLRGSTRPRAPRTPALTGAAGVAATGGPGGSLAASASCCAAGAGWGREEARKTVAAIRRGHAHAGRGDGGGVVWVVVEALLLPDLPLLQPAPEGRVSLRGEEPTCFACSGVLGCACEGCASAVEQAEQPDAVSELSGSAHKEGGGGGGWRAECGFGGLAQGPCPCWG